MKALFISVSTSLILVFITANSFAAIYQSVDEDGNVVFSDRSEPGSKEKILSPSNTLVIKKHPNGQSERKSITGLGTLKFEEKKALKYKSIAIISPKQDKTIRDNLGNIELKLQMSPGLQTNFGHKIKVEFDGKVRQASWTTSSILFTNVDRGSHSLRAFIVDESGKRLKSSALVTFHLQRFSRRFK